MTKHFSIAEIEQYSLIKAHTFRTWEQRYNIFIPQRTASNIRYYTLDDLSFLLDFSLLNRYGNKVSALAGLSRHEVRQKVLHLNDDTAKMEQQINQLIICMFALDIEDFELTLDSAVSYWGIDRTIEKIILPFLERLELFSYKGRTSGAYHFVVTALRKKLILGIEKSSPKESVAKSALLFLPEGEHYDLFLLYLNYRLRNAGLNILYLGTNIAARNLEEIIERKNPHFLVSYYSKKEKNYNKDLSLFLNREHPETSYFIAGAGSFTADRELKGKVMYVPYQQASQQILALS